MKNVITGWITSILGLLIMVVDSLYFFGIIDLPNINHKPIEVGFAFLVGLILFLVPAGKLETILESKAKDLTDKVK
jgi:hypothetical protein